MKQVVRTYEELVEVFKFIKGGTNFDNPMEIEFKPYSANRSLSQNALFHLWVSFITGQLNQKNKVTGIEFNSDFVKTDLKRRFGIVKTSLKISGATGAYLLSTAKYNKDELSEFLTKINVWACDIGITLPAPICKEYETYKEASQ